MKRTIFFCISTLLLLTSCKVGNGEQREPIEVGHGIVHWTEENLMKVSNMLESIFIIDLYLTTDPALREEIFDERLKNSVVEYDTTTNTIMEGYRYVDGTVDYYRTIATDGLLLSEGGTWRVNGQGTTITSDGGVMTATINTRIDDNSQVDAKLRIEEYGYDKEKGAFDVKYDGDIYIVEQREYTYTLSIDVVKSIEYTEGRIVGGELDVEYNYSATEHIDKVYMTYDKDGRISFSYRGYTNTTQY
ncbi:MAG: hypothetical protein IKJ38_04880 [Alistipes sp.]|nr:hypothetical protein [Alistipes sp.]